MVINKISVLTEITKSHYWWLQNTEKFSGDVDVSLRVNNTI